MSSTVQQLFPTLSLGTINNPEQQVEQPGTQYKANHVGYEGSHKIAVKRGKTRLGHCPDLIPSVEGGGCQIISLVAGHMKRNRLRTGHDIRHGLSGSLLEITPLCAQTLLVDLRGRISLRRCALSRHKLDVFVCLPKQDDTVLGTIVQILPKYCTCGTDLQSGRHYCNHRTIIRSQRLPYRDQPGTALIHILSTPYHHHLRLKGLPETFCGTGVLQ